MVTSGNAGHDHVQTGGLNTPGSHSGSQSLFSKVVALRHNPFYDTCQSVDRGDGSGLLEDIAAGQCAKRAPSQIRQVAS